MKIYIAQSKPKIGNLNYNFELIQKAYDDAISCKADICVFPEQVTTGYCPEDLLLKPSFIKDLEFKLQQLIPTISSVVALIPTPISKDAVLHTGVIAIQNGQVIGTTFKKHLPNYGVFNEKRYFTSGKSQVIEINGYKVGVPICEDIWFSDVCFDLKNQGAKILIVPNSSPYEKGKFEKRLLLAKQRYHETSLPIIYCNQVLGQDGIVFDGRSFAYDGELKHLLKSFEQDQKVVEISNGKIVGSTITSNLLSSEDEVYGAMVLGLRDYVRNNNASSVLLGLSGGIDSALVAAIAVDSLGADNVYTYMLPSKFTSLESMNDAASIAQMLGIYHKVIPINDMLQSALHAVEDASDLAKENLQARIRGMLLMLLSNSTNRLLITTGNKSEIATGYATLYGDMCGAFNPIKDLYKTEVFKLASYRNMHVPTSIKVESNIYPVMPHNVITKAPSAELRENQKDSDSLPEYPLLDAILILYLEQDLGFDEICSQGYDKQTVARIIKLIKGSEFKRKQSALGVKISTKNFEKDRRYPITNGYLE